MTRLSPDDRPVRINVREIAICANSPLEARRLADALPAALERAFASPQLDGVMAPRRPGRADRVAGEIARQVADRVRRAK